MALQDWSAMEYLLPGPADDMALLLPNRALARRICLGELSDSPG
jgi:hypothetical protein